MTGVGSKGGSGVLACVGELRGVEFRPSLSSVESGKSKVVGG